MSQTYFSCQNIKQNTNKTAKMEQIELSDIVIDGLKCLNTSISSDLTKKLISNAVKMALYSDASELNEIFNIKSEHSGKLLFF